jgi:hypothetical protein
MTEAEWLAYRHPQPMLAFLDAKSSARKWRLFAVACGRRAAVWSLLNDPRSRRAVEVAEGYANGTVTADELRAVASAASAAARGIAAAQDGYDRDGLYTPPACAASAAALAASADTASAASLAHQAVPEEQAAQATLVREVFGNPFRPVSLPPSIRTLTVVTLAQAIYDDRAFECLPVLADALEEAGCTDVDILAHCRGPGPHVRGCWVVDLVLGKS